MTTTPAKVKPKPQVIVVEQPPRSLARDVLVGVLVGVVTLELVRRLHAR